MFMRSVQLQRAYEKMMEIGEPLTAYDFPQDCWVYVKHEDGSEFRFANAFAIEYTQPKDEWRDELECLMVFTEHNEYHVFSVDDLNDYHAYRIPYLPPPSGNVDLDQDLKDIYSRKIVPIPFSTYNEITKKVDHGESDEQ